MRILLMPDGGEGAGAASAGGSAGVSGALEEPGMMDAVFERLQLPKELRGSEAGKKTPNSKPQTPEKHQAPSSKEKAGEAEVEVKAEEEEARPDEEDGVVAGPNEQEDENEEEEAAVEPELTPEVKEWVEGQMAAVREEVTTATAKVTGLEAEKSRLEAELVKAKATPLEIAAIHPLFLADDVEAIGKEEAALESFEKWALENWDGTEEIRDEKSGKIIQPAYTKQEVRGRYAELKGVREKVIPAARAALEGRKAARAAAAQVYPELFDAKRPESGLLELVLKQAPGLKALFPNPYLVIGDAIAGERIRLAKEAAAKKAGNGKPAAGKNGNGKLLVKGPRPGPGSGAPAGAGAKRGNEISAKRFMEMGGDRKALVNMLTNADLPTGKG